MSTSKSMLTPPLILEVTTGNRSQVTKYSTRRESATTLDSPMFVSVAAPARSFPKRKTLLRFSIP